MAFSHRFIPMGPAVIMGTIATRPSTVHYLGASASLAAELAWILNLLVQTAGYAEPALDELDRTLLPGVMTLRPKVMDRFTSVFRDELSGCPELLIVAAMGGCLADQEPRRLLGWLSTLPKKKPAAQELLTEPVSNRRPLRRRLALLDADIRARRAYRNIVAEVWELAGPAWQRRGRAAAARAAADWNRKLRSTTTTRALVQLMPPRHPLTRREPPDVAALFRRRPRFALVPAYFCMSGGVLADVGDQLHVGVPASALEPVRRTRDAAFVADRLRNLAEPTRVHILIYLMTAPSGVMDVTRALGMTQPTVSEHVRVLSAAGLVRRVRKGSRTVYSVSTPSLERLLEDARATLVRWR
ncbi:MAG TPA: metalloregulator ArsR/SmtB family transcription factor [Candidatus Dormibacteraeota bacterium]|nr:metalloregulator ArsR/SmtB family transcription factor [Candidatus Dormibacteraeota bacterium]